MRCPPHGKIIRHQKTLLYFERGRRAQTLPSNFTACISRPMETKYAPKHGIMIKTLGRNQTIVKNQIAVATILQIIDGCLVGPLRHFSTQIKCDRKVQPQKIIKQILVGPSSQISAQAGRGKRFSPNPCMHFQELQEYDQRKLP